MQNSKNKKYGVTVFPTGLACHYLRPNKLDPILLGRPVPISFHANGPLFTLRKFKDLAVFGFYLFGQRDRVVMNKISAIQVQNLSILIISEIFFSPNLIKRLISY